MTAARLEELAWKCEQDSAVDVLTRDDLRNLARCARAWAKVERMKGQVSMEHTVACYFWRNQKGQGDYSTGTPPSKPSNRRR